MNAQPATRRRIGIGVLAMCAMLLSGCAAGQHAATAGEIPAIDGAGGSVGTIQLHAVAIQTPPHGTSYPAGGIAQVKLVIVNTGPEADNLVGVNTPAASASRLFANPADAAAFTSPSPTVSTSTSATSSSSSSGSASASTSASPSTSTSPSASPSQPAGLASLAVPPGASVALGIGAQGPVLVLAGLAKALYPGTSVSITFHFAGAGAVTLVVPVQVSVLPSGSGLVVPSGTSAE